MDDTIVSGVVLRWLETRGYGFLEAEGSPGETIFAHRNNLLHDGDLCPGDGCDSAFRKSPRRPGHNEAFDIVVLERAAP